MKKLSLLLLIILSAVPASAQTQTQRGVARMITRSASDPIVPVQGVQVVVGNVANKNVSDKNGRFSIQVPVNREHSYKLAGVRLPKNSDLILASPLLSDKCYLSAGNLVLAFTTAEEKQREYKALYVQLQKKYNKQRNELQQLRDQLKEQRIELKEGTTAYNQLTVRLDSVQALLNQYFDEKQQENATKELQRIAEQLAVTDYQSLEAEDAHIYELMCNGDWATLSDYLLKLMNGDAATYVQDKVDANNAAKATYSITSRNLAIALDRIQKAIESYKNQYDFDNASYYFDILLHADSTNWEYLTQAGLFYEEWSYFKEAQKYLQRALSYAENDTLKAKSYENIGNLYYVYATDDYSRAKDFYQKALKTYIAVHGELHPNVASNYGYIGHIYQIQGDYERAKEYYQKALNIRIDVLGELHPDVGSTYKNLGDLYYIDDIARAEEYYQKALKVRLATLDEQDFDVVISYNDLGFAYYVQGKYSQAEECYQKALKIRLAVYGELHPFLAFSYDHLGNVCCRQSDYDRAAEYYQKALNIRLVVYGEHDSHVVTSYNNLGEMYRSQGDYERAIEYYQKALGIRLIMYGEQNALVASSYNDLGEVYLSQGDYERTIEYYQKALLIRVALFGEQHDLVPISYDNLGYVYRTQGDYERAVEYYQKALKIRLAMAGEKNPLVPTSYNNLGLVYYSQGDYACAKKYFQKALDIAKADLGEEHSYTKLYQKNLNATESKLAQQEQ